MEDCCCNASMGVVYLRHDREWIGRVVSKVRELVQGIIENLPRQSVEFDELPLHRVEPKPIANATFIRTEPQIPRKGKPGPKAKPRVYTILGVESLSDPPKAKAKPKIGYRVPKAKPKPLALTPAQLAERARLGETNAERIERVRKAHSELANAVLVMKASKKLRHL